MTFKRPEVVHSKTPKNELGLLPQDYEGLVSTMCAGCGHDSIAYALIQAFYELSITPHHIVKISGIGCSSIMPAYFVQKAQGFNTAHGRSPAITTGANAAYKDFKYVNISGDGDSLAIGLGQLSHAIRRNVNVLYIIANNGVYGLTKGQFSPSSSQGATTKKGLVNLFNNIDPVLLALNLGASFVGRSFSGDKTQLVPLMKAGLLHEGFALLDVYSPCVTFNNHDSSALSYHGVREAIQEVVMTDYIPVKEKIKADYDEGTTTKVQLHDGSFLLLHKVDKTYDPTNREKAHQHVMENLMKNRLATGLLFIDEKQPDMHGLMNTTKTPLRELDMGALCPGSEALNDIQRGFR